MVTRKQGKGGILMNPREHLGRKSEISRGVNNDGVVQKIYSQPVDSWFQKRLVYLRKKLKKEIQTEVIRLTKDQ
jgi:hypothetical protein